jgi:hypothetical protein
MVIWYVVTNIWDKPDAHFSGKLVITYQTSGSQTNLSRGRVQNLETCSMVTLLKTCSKSWKKIFINLQLKAKCEENVIYLTLLYSSLLNRNMLSGCFSTATRRWSSFVDFLRLGFQEVKTKDYSRVVQIHNIHAKIMKRFTKHTNKFNRSAC